ncbi:hypothetical protein [Actinoplanes sp. NPDC049118]|uniref:hypothetical protein n=1 Tax=Actinoplanes sp. NPDC049118 TaxID=3155769 RepID=UPI0033F4CF02
MAEVVDYGMFATWLAGCDGRGARWTLLRRFQREWGIDPDDEMPPLWYDTARRALAGTVPPPDGDDMLDGVDPALPVPRALDEWWRLPYNSFLYQPRLYWVHPVYPPKFEATSHAGPIPADDPLLHGTDDRRVCVFMAEYQYCNVWGYPAAQAAHADPVALVTTDDGWTVQADTLSGFFLHQAVYRIPRLLGFTATLDEAPPGFADADLPELGLRPWRQLGSNVTMYGAPDAIVYVDATAGGSDQAFTAAARTEEALKNLTARLGIEASASVSPPTWRT